MLNGQFLCASSFAANKGARGRADGEWTTPRRQRVVTMVMVKFLIFMAVVKDSGGEQPGLFSCKGRPRDFMISQQERTSRNGINIIIW